MHIEIIQPAKHNAQPTKHPILRRFNDTRGAAFLCYMRHPIDSINEWRLMRKKSPARLARSMIKHGLDEVKAGNKAGASVLFDGAAKQALKAKHPVSRVYLLLGVYDAYRAAGLPTFAATMLLLAEGQADKIENIYEKRDALLAIKQKYSKHPITPPDSKGPFMSVEEFLST